MLTRAFSSSDGGCLKTSGERIGMLDFEIPSPPEAEIIGLTGREFLKPTGAEQGKVGRVLLHGEAGREFLKPAEGEQGKVTRLLLNGEA